MITLAALLVWYGSPRRGAEIRYLFIAQPADLKLDEDFTPFELPVELNSSHPQKTGTTLEVMEEAPFQALYDQNASRIRVSPLKGRSGRGEIHLTATLDNMSVTKSFTISVSALNDPPQPRSRYFETPEDTPLRARLKAHDPDGDILTFTILTPPEKGMFTAQKNGRFTYTPPRDFTGKVTFVYRAADAKVSSTSRTATIRVKPVNDPPEALPGEFQTDEEKPLVATLSMRDIDSDSLTARIIRTPEHGRLELLSRGRFRYTPGKDFYGTDRFRFAADDGKARSTPQEVAINVNNINDRPVALKTETTCREDTPCSGRLHVRDSDSKYHRFSLKSQPKHGKATLGKEGRFSYLPDTNYYGSDRFEFSVTDGKLESLPAGVTLTVRSDDDDALAAVGRLGGAVVTLYDYDTLDAGKPTPLYTTRTSTGKQFEAIGKIALPPQGIRPDGMYILTVEGGRNYDYDADGRLDRAPTPNRGTVHLLIPGSAILAEHVSVNVLGELIYRRLATRLKAGYDKPNLLATLDELSGEYLADDIDGDRKVTYADILSFDYRRHTDRLKQPADFFQKAIKQLHQNITLSNGLTSRCSETPSEDLIYDVVLNGGYAYIANGSRGLTIVRKEDLHAKPLVQYDTPGYTRAVESSDTIVYLADGSAGIRIVDVSDLENPKTRATLDTFWYALDLELKFPYLYVTDGSAGLIAISVRDPDRPEQTALVDTPGYAFGLAVAGDFAYVADGPTGLVIIDISDPGTPKTVTTYDTPGYAFDVTVDGPYAYIADGSAGIVIVDIRDKKHPKPVSTIATDATTFAVEKDGEFLYTGEYEGGVRVWDVGNPKAPFKTAAYSELCGVFNIKIVSGYIYACDDYSGLVRLKKVRNQIP